MKLLIPIILVLAACSGPQIAQEKCTIYEEYGANPGNSLIAAKIHDPCVALRLITIAAKAPVIVWEKQYVHDFDMWADVIETVVQDNINYADLQNLILAEVSKLNQKAGLALLVVSDSIFVFNERGLLKPKDVEIILGLIAHLRREVDKMGVLV